jgi:alanyl-tRNA synthetase
VVAIFTGRGGSTAGFVDAVTPESGVVGVILNETSFYYESGGQVYDTGALNVLAGTSVDASLVRGGVQWVL